MEKIWDFSKKPKLDKDRSLFIRLLGRYGLENELVINIPESGTYEKVGKTITTFDKFGDMKKQFELPEALVAEIQLIDTEAIEFQDFNLNSNMGELN